MLCFEPGARHGAAAAGAEMDVFGRGVWGCRGSCDGWGISDEMDDHVTRRRGGDAVLDVGDECPIRIERLGAAKAARKRTRVGAFMVVGAVCV